MSEDPTIRHVRRTKEVQDADRRVWLDENRAAIDAYNALVAKRGVFSDGRRRF
jgi:post-segregation antitoxin (ccd killing protein)